MLWTAFVWGVGVSFGAACGAMFFVVLQYVFWRIVDPDAKSKAETYRQYMMEAMAHRNEIAMEANEHLEAIAAAMYECEDEDQEDDEDKALRG